MTNTKKTKLFAAMLLPIFTLFLFTLSSCEDDDDDKKPTEEEIQAETERVQFLTGLAQGLATPARTPILRTPDEYGMEYEEISFEAPDGITLKGWFIPADSKKLIICNHFSPGNRYGYPGHLEEWNNAGGFEVNFLPKYKALHDAGYNVLVYDMRNHGESDKASEGISGVGAMEWGDVVGSIRYAKEWEKTAGMAISLQSICMGCNATLNAMEKHPEDFKDIVSWIAIQPLRGRTFIERTCETMGYDIEEGIETFSPIYEQMTGLSIDDHEIANYTKYVNMPTLVLQVRNDMSSRESDIQAFFDDLSVEDKKMIWVEDTPWRFRGYTYFSEHPQEMVSWYNSFMN